MLQRSLKIMSRAAAVMAWAVGRMVSRWGIWRCGGPQEVSPTVAKSAWRANGTVMVVEGAR
jgi:hypothetical protein